MVTASREQLLKSLVEIGLSKESSVLHALEISENIHKNQKRDSGNSYLVEHIYPVTLNLISRHKTHKDIKKLIITCLLHDGVEDGDLAEGYLSKEFDEEIEKYVMAVTKKKVTLTEKPTQEWLFNQMAESIKNVEEGGEIAQIVKMEDRIQNAESMSVDSNKKEKYLRMIKEVRDLFIPLAKGMNPEYNYDEILTSEANRIESLLS